VYTLATRHREVRSAGQQIRTWISSARFAAAYWGF
jgi:hypothetical protein